MNQLTHPQPAWLRRQWRSVGAWCVREHAKFDRRTQGLAAMQTRNMPAAATTAKPVALLPLIVKCAACPEKVDSNSTDDHGRCISCSANAAAAEMIRDAEVAELERAEREQAAAATAEAEQVAKYRGAGSPPRLPDEAAPKVAFAAHATEALPQVAAETASVRLDEAPLDYVALGYVAAAATDADATCRAQLMLTERHDVPGLMAGIAAGLSAFEARRAYAEFQAEQALAGEPVSA